jgi:thiamine pyrophosphate-dependent acetolactate synthase large subunit-like protein
MSLPATSLPYCDPSCCPQAIPPLQYLATSLELAKQLNEPIFSQRWDALAASHLKRLARISELAKPFEDDSFGTGHLCSMIRKAVPNDTIFCVEAVTNTFFVADNIQATRPGSFINCGAGGLGWSGGAALGVKLASEYENGPGKGKFVCQIVGDGSYMFSLPGSVYWISQRYNIPVLTVVLNNNGQLRLAIRPMAHILVSLKLT